MSEAEQLLRWPLCTALCVHLAIVWPQCHSDERIKTRNLHCETQPDPLIAGLCRRTEPRLEDRGGFHHLYACGPDCASEVYCEQPLTAEEAQAIDRYLALERNDDSRLRVCLMYLQGAFAYDSTHDPEMLGWRIPCERDAGR